MLGVIVCESEGVTQENDGVNKREKTRARSRKLKNLKTEISVSIKVLENTQGEDRRARSLWMIIRSRLFISRKPSSETESFVSI